MKTQYICRNCGYNSEFDLYTADYDPPSCPSCFHYSHGDYNWWSYKLTFSFYPSMGTGTNNGRQKCH